MVMITNSFDKFPNEPTGLMYEQFGKIGVNPATAVTFEDDFTTAKSWGKTGTLMARNASTNVMDWNCDSSSIQSSTYDLGSALSTKFVIRSKLTIDQIDIMATDSYQGYFGVYSADHATGVASTQNGFALYILNDAGGNAKQYRIRVDDGTSGFGNTAGDGGNFTKKPTVETVYSELIRNADVFTINLYSDSTYSTSTLIEGKSFTQTGVTGLQYLGIKNHLRDSTGGLNGTWDDVKVYNNVTSVEPASPKVKQHFIEYFSGKQLPSYWTETLVSGGTISMSDTVDGGLKLTTVSADKATMTFNGKRQYSHNSSVLLTVFKFDSTQASTIQAIALSDESTQSPRTSGANTAGFSDVVNQGTYYVDHGDGVGAVVNTNSGVSVDTNWHIGKLTLGSSSLIFEVDGSAIGSTITTDLPTTNLQPNIHIDSGTAKNLHVRYLEAYNT